MQPGSNKLSPHCSVCKALLKPVPVARGKLGRGGRLPALQVPPSPPTASHALLPLGRAPREQPRGPGTPRAGQGSAHPGSLLLAALWLCHHQCHHHDLCPVCGCSRTFPGTGRGSRRSWQGFQTRLGVGTAGNAHPSPLAPAVPRTPEPQAAAGLGGAGSSGLSSAKQVWAPHRLIWDPS